MHVALYSPGWPLSRHRNGVVTYVHWMREELRRLGHRVSIFTAALATPEEDVHCVVESRWQRARARLREPAAAPEDRVFTWGAVLGDAIRAVHAKSPIDVVEMEETFGWAADVAERTRLPVVVKLHGPAFMSLVEEELGTPFADRKIEVEGAALRRLRILTSPARQTLDDTIARYDLAPVIARHVVNPLRLPPTAPLWNTQTCDADTLLFVGRFDKRKGGDTVLRAFTRLLDARPALKLVFVGPDAGVTRTDGSVQHFDALIAELLPGRTAPVSFRGLLAPEAIVGLRTEAFLTVVASRWENQSYTALEAMLQGCPLVSTDVGGQREIVIDGATGLLAAADDPVDLASKIDAMLSDPARAAAIAERARLLTSERHDPARVCAETLDVYRAAIEDARKSGRGAA
jgi:glycosyltransferase involved in cell wall biosynthesis